ncbi:helix-turn-helix domain-containing protein [Labilibaculum manganireducens]|uniref:helix-turn-helix domain-containing protein n=1 Tax=Labilibaculum manganireducens TaxID=1940525 RepID=UPI0029F54437|nr:helix-turn-helix domain-containing protein [Labilibaculum manganireducens]
MDIAFIYIGFAQSIFVAIMVFLKKPLTVADRILGCWLFTIAGMFLLNVVKNLYAISEELWPFSVNLAITFPTFLYLYTKYISQDHNHFLRKDYLNFAPLLIGVTIVLLTYSSEINSLESFIEHYCKLINVRTIVGHLFVLCLWIYTILSLIILFRHKRQIANNYSFESRKINLWWLFTVITAYFLVYNFIILISAFHIQKSFIEHIEKFRSGALLVFVYILSIWGYRQHQLISNYKSVSLSKFIKPDSERYEKSSLKEKQAENFTLILIDFMNKSEAWKDNELSIAKLSEQTDIPKHYITQVLNENLKKNFYTFVNEYRTEYAMKLILSPTHKNWSFIAIAYECGFNSKTAFNNFFKKYTNLTPTEFKKSNTLI